MNRLRGWLWLALLLWGLWGGHARAGSVSIEAQSTLSHDGARLSGDIRLVLRSGRPLYHLQVTGQDQGATPTPLANWSHWDPDREQRLALDLAAPGLESGHYHLLLSVLFQDVSGYWSGVALAIPYTVRVKPPDPPFPPSLTLHGAALVWDVAGPPRQNLTATLTTAPWRPLAPLTPEDYRLHLLPEPERRYPTHARIAQLARLDWLQEGVHHSRILPWQATTDDRGSWQPVVAAATLLPDTPWLWRSAALLLALVALLGGGLRLCRLEPPLAIAGLLAVTLWPLPHLSPELWLLDGWPTGGDLASHAFYAQVFTDLVAQGRISGWLPEVFAGFPAFIHYFPLPFLLVAALAGPLGVAVALKWVAMVAAVLLPPATYGMGVLLGWPVAGRLLAAAAASGFLVNTGNSIWGGNFLSQLAGEFANNWGFLFLPLFLGSLGRVVLTPGLSPRARRNWGLAAVLLALAMALSHGYVWLTALAGSGLMAIARRRPLAACATVTAIHLTAALLAGFWLLPFLATGAWTIANDGASQTTLAALWPESLWPFAVAWLFFRPVPGLSAPLAVALTGVVGALAAPWIGLADIRFIPYGQWGVAVAGGAVLGGWLTRYSRRPLWWSLALVALLLSWWPTFMSQAKGWSQWNLEGYQQKALAPEYRQLATFLARDLAAPRIAVEHHPYNDDLGSTRAVEALPLFGSGAVLEGLYMEAAITGPFIYQMQSEISRFPSSPLARFPAMGGDVQRAVGHMQEFYTDTLVLRSPEMQTRFEADSRFATVGRFGPYRVVKLSRLDSALVEPVTTPLRAVPRKDWQVTAFQRFILDHPYGERLVFRDGTAPLAMAQPAARCLQARVQVTVMERERLVFTTDQPGCPHLVRMTYHDFWRLSSGGTAEEEILLVEPAFMVVHPVGPRVELRFDPGPMQRRGLVLSGLGLGLLVVLVVAGGRFRDGGAEEAGGWRRRHAMLLTGLAGLALALYYHSPERDYLTAHRLLADQHPGAAAALFDKSWPRRKGWAKQAEGLFWEARTRELAEQKTRAAAGYRRLQEQFPASYWAPESLYRLAQLAWADGDQATYRFCRELLRRRYPGNRWTLQE